MSPQKPSTYSYSIYSFIFTKQPVLWEVRDGRGWILASVSLFLSLHLHNDHAWGTEDRVELFLQAKTLWSLQGYYASWQLCVGENDEAENCAIISVFPFNQSKVQAAAFRQLCLLGEHLRLAFMWIPTTLGCAHFPCWSGYQVRQ